MSLAKDLKTYKPFALNVFQRNLSYKANVIMFFIGDGMILVVTYYLWKAIYASSSSSVINGFNFNEMVVYVMMSFLTGLIINTDVSYSIMSEVKDGSIAINLIRPISYQKRMLFEGLGNVLYNFVILFIMGSMGLTFFMYQVGMSLTWERVVTYFISIAMGIMLNFYYSYTFGLLSFKLTNMWGIYQIMGEITQLLSGALIPLVFFPEWAQGLLNYLPFSSMIYMPTMIYLGKLETEQILSALFIQLVWVVILAVIAQLVWKKLIKQLVILGGMRWMKRYARLYIKFMQQYIKSLLEYRGDFILGLVGFFFVQFVGIIFLQLVFNAIPSLSGWSFYEILFIYGFAQIPRGIDHVFTDYLWIFSQ